MALIYKLYEPQFFESPTLIIQFGQVNISIQAIVTEIYYSSNHGISSQTIEHRCARQTLQLFGLLMVEQMNSRIQCFSSITLLSHPAVLKGGRAKFYITHPPFPSLTTTAMEIGFGGKHLRSTKRSMIYGSFRVFGSKGCKTESFLNWVLIDQNRNSAEVSRRAIVPPRKFCPFCR